MTTDQLDRRLADLRRAPQWSDTEQSAVLDHILGTEPAAQRADRRLTTTRLHGRRPAAVATAVALAAAACIAVPAVLPAGSPGSAGVADAQRALHHLAHIAAVSPTDRLGPDQFLHLVDTESQAGQSGQPDVESRYEYWIRADGQTWQLRDEDSGAGVPTEEVWLTPPGPQAIDGMDEPVHLDELPTAPSALESYVRDHTTGSTSADERVFVAVVDIVRRGLATPALRSAALDVLAHLGHVQLGDETRDSLGDPVQAFEFVDPSGRPEDVRTIMFDTRTAQITEEQEFFRGALFFTRTVPVLEVVDTVPASIRDRAIVQN